MVLSNNNLDSFPAVIFSNKRVKSLDLSYNHIKDIPANLEELTDLRYLYLQNNNISQLHNGILKVKSLRCLYLYGNPMKGLPDFIKEKAKFSVFTDREVHRFFPEFLFPGYNKLQDEIAEETDKIIHHDTLFDNTSVVPSIFDSDLTYGRHCDRKGKSLNTCVLFVDIRDSVKKNKEHKSSTLAKMYYSFVYGVLKIADAYHGHVRNIIGDRVMLVFDEDNCCDNAVRCAGSIMYFCKNTMSKILPNGIFNCGIGIHFGNIKVIEVGIKKQGKDSINYKDLIWIGDPANLSSRLTDMAGKNNIPGIIISKDVLIKISDKSLRNIFVSIDKRYFKDVDFNIYGCNLIIK